MLVGRSVGQTARYHYVVIVSFFWGGGGGDFRGVGDRGTVISGRINRVAWLY